MLMFSKQHVASTRNDFGKVALTFVLQSEAVIRRCSLKNGILKISQRSQEKTCVGLSFLIKLQTLGFIKKEILIHVFSCRFFEICQKISLL